MCYHRTRGSLSLRSGSINHSCHPKLRCIDKRFAIPYNMASTACAADPTEPHEDLADKQMRSAIIDALSPPTMRKATLGKPSYTNMETTSRLLTLCMSWVTFQPDEIQRGRSLFPLLRRMRITQTSLPLAAEATNFLVPTLESSIHVVLPIAMHHSGL
jgi:hypothetical protein